MFSAAHELELQDAIVAYAGKALPPMAHSGDGLAADFAVDALRASVLQIANRALDEFSRRRNGLARVNQLPTELLLHIASYLPFRALVQAIHVCKRWHTALCSDPSLWTNVNMSFHYPNGGWADTLRQTLERAPQRCTTLCVQATIPSDEVAPVADLVCGTFSSLRHLCVSLDDIDGSPWFSVFSAPALQLRTLQVHSSTTKTLRLPDNLFSGSAPHLISIMLVNTYMSSTPGPALSKVWDFGYYAMPFVSTADVMQICTTLPSLTDLTIVSDQFDCDDVPDTFVPPTLDRICLRSFVPEGILETIVAANRRNTELRILQATGTLRQLVLAGVERIAEVYAVSEPYRHHQASLVVKGDAEYARCIEYEPFFSVLDVLRMGRARLAAVTRLAISDALLSLLLHEEGLHAAFAALETLTVILTHEASVPCRHLFGGPDDPPLDACAALQTVRLSAHERYSLVYDPVVLCAEHVRRWIPNTTKTLVLRGVRFDEESLQMPCDVRREWGFARDGHDEYLYWDVSWWQSYPCSSSLYV